MARGEERAAVTLPAMKVLVREIQWGKKNSRFTAVKFIFLYIKFSGGMNDSFQLDSFLRVLSTCEREWRQVAVQHT